MGWNWISRVVWNSWKAKGVFEMSKFQMSRIYIIYIIIWNRCIEMIRDGLISPSLIKAHTIYSNSTYFIGKSTVYTGGGNKITRQHFSYDAATCEVVGIRI